MTAPIIIATPHGIEAVEAVVQYGHSHDDARALREFMPSKFDPVGPLINYGEPFPPGTIVHFVDALGDEWHGRGGGVRRDGSGQEWDTPWDKLPERRFPMRVGTKVFPYIYTPFGPAPKPKPGQWLVRHHDNTVTIHDTDPRVEPTYPEWRINILGDVTDYAEFDNEASARQWLKNGDTLSHRPHYPVTIAGKPYTLVGEWVEVED